MLGTKLSKLAKEPRGATAGINYAVSRLEADSGIEVDELSLWGRLEDLLHLRLINSSAFVLLLSSAFFVYPARASDPQPRL